jgi:hypothetical protein
METLWDFLTYTKGWAYIFAFLMAAGFIPFWAFLTDRERAD